VRSAEAELDLLKSGARLESVVVAEAAIAEAEAAVQRAQADLANTELRAPVAGVVTTLS
jgi:multidrug resistance efflux pump